MDKNSQKILMILIGCFLLGGLLIWSISYFGFILPLRKENNKYEHIIQNKKDSLRMYEKAIIIANEKNKVLDKELDSINKKLEYYENKDYVIEVLPYDTSNVSIYTSKIRSILSEQFHK